MFTASFSSDAPGPFSVTIHAPDRESSIAMLVVRDAKYQGDFTIFRQGPGAMAEFLAIGRAIVEQCEALMPDSADASDALLASAPSEPVAPIDDATTIFQPGTRVEMHHKLGLLSGTVTLVSRDGKTARVKFDGTGDEDCGVETSSLRLEDMPF